MMFLNDELNRFVEPKKGRVIFYETRFNMHGVELFWGEKIGSPSSRMKSMRTPTYPDFYSFKGCYLDLDPFLWHFFSQPFEIPI